MSNSNNFFSRFHLPEKRPDERSYLIHRDGDLSKRGLSIVLTGVLATGAALGIAGPAFIERIGAELATEESKEQAEAVKQLPGCTPGEVVVIVERDAITRQIGEVSMCRIDGEAFVPIGK